ncbi:MAG: YebC/PmpR family DNA-binding regulatory protein [Saprospiraceae bacterium]|jgi:YebC/PmpR family DNA-binding regulatory protein
MAGHSKWANIKHRKAAQDAKRGKVFTKWIREITVAARSGGGEADSNPRLRSAVDKALGSNMTRDTIDRAISRGIGDLDGQVIEEVVYEGYAPNGVAVLVECATDNKNRTVAEVRHAFSKAGGNLGTDGSVAYLFTKQGSIVFSGVEEDEIMEAALDAGAEDIEVEEGMAEVITAFGDYFTVLESLKAAGFEPEMDEIVQRASLEVELDEEAAEKITCLIDVLEELDDVQNVFTNASFPDSD